MPTLTWLTRSDDIRQAAKVPYRALVGMPEHDYGESGADNLLIQGDNLDGLKALCPYYAEKIKCIFIDPPYNTRKDFEHYQDNLEHAQWLEMMYPRLELLHDLLADDGSIWVIIDDDEAHYLKVLMDEIFGRKNFVANVVWQKKTAPQGHAKWFSDNHDHIFVYAKKKEIWRLLPSPRTSKQDARYNRTDDPRGLYTPDNFTISLTGGQRGAQYAKTGVSANIYEIVLPSGRKVMPPKGRCWLVREEKYFELLEDDLMCFAKHGDGVPMVKRFLKDVRESIVPLSVMLHSELGGNTEAKKEVREFNSDNVFSTPKPERLIQRVLQLATKPGDIVLDSFLGSGTTAAVAHKMGRRWIGMEMGEHAKTHCVPRLRAVIDGESGGISEAEKWHGGGGFHFLRLGDEIFTEDGAVNPKITFHALAAHLWFAETHTPLAPQKRQSPFLGVHHNTGYALLYNGVLNDKKVNGGNVLTAATLAHIRKAAKKHDGKIIVFANACRFGDARLKSENLEFRQIPYDCKKR